MGMREKSQIKRQNSLGRAKRMAGKEMGDNGLVREGAADQVHAHARGIRERVMDRIDGARKSLKKPV